MFLSLELGNLVSKLETKNSMTFAELRGGLNRGFKEELLSVSILVLVKH